MDLNNRVHSKWRWSHFLNKILIVDASEVDCIRISFILQRNGYDNITISSSGQEALSIVKEQHPDLVLCNTQLPDMTGFELSKQISDLVGDRSKVVLMAESSNKIDTHKVREAGAVDFLLKGQNLEYLSRTVHDLIES